jgi:RNA polymerase sigma-70 factor (sigma-E family)
MIGAEVRRDEVSEAPGRLAELYRRHAPDAARLAYLLTGDRALAEDLTQEAFVRLYARFRDLRNPDALPWYLRRTVVNLARSHFRKVKVERAYVKKETRVPIVAEHDVGTRDEMWQALLELPERQRAAIVLRYYEDLSEKETADVLRCPVGTVKSLTSRGLERLRGEMSRGE